LRWPILHTSDNVVFMFKGLGGARRRERDTLFWVYFWHVAFHDRLSPLPSNALSSVSRWPVLKEVSLSFVNGG